MKMRILNANSSIFDTQVDTRKIFVPMKHQFVLRKYLNREGKSPIYLFITHKKERERISVDLHVYPALWDPKKERLIGDSKEAQDINLIIDNIESKITSIKTLFRLSETVLTLEKFMEEFRNGVPRIDFNTFFEYELKNMKEAMNPNTYRKQKSVAKALREFKPKLLFADFDKSVVDKFKAHRRKQGIKDSSINANLAVIKKFMKIAQDKGIRMPIKPSDIKVGSTNGERESLTPIELNKLRGYYESSFIRDNHKWPLAKFLFACFTSLRISDAQAVRKTSINNGLLKFTAVKTLKDHKIKLNAAAVDIVNSCPTFFTEEHTDQHINRILKDICKLLGITRNVTFHYARHTFATNYLRNGGAVQSLQKILGHSSIEQTMIYVTVLQEQMDEEIMLLDNIPIIKDSPTWQKS